MREIIEIYLIIIVKLEWKIAVFSSVENFKCNALIKIYL